MKTTKNTKTKVLFRYWRGGVIALFPQIASTVDKPQFCLSYAHVGQHGAADCSGIICASRPATRAEYRDLAAELRCIGYKLDIRQRTGRADYEMRKAAA